MRCNGCRAIFVMTVLSYNNGSIDNNMSYLDARALEVFQAGDADFRRASWSTYQNLHMCRLGVCPNWLWSLDVYGLSTPTAIIHSRQAYR
eukprot:scaffold11559_cov128-Isochrysis_galbana.AAC.5